MYINRIIVIWKIFFPVFLFLGLPVLLMSPERPEVAFMEAPWEYFLFGGANALLLMIISHTKAVAWLVQENITSTVYHGGIGLLFGLVLQISFFYELQLTLLVWWFIILYALYCCKTIIDLVWGVSLFKVTVPDDRFICSDRQTLQPGMKFFPGLWNNREFRSVPKVIEARFKRKIDDAGETAATAVIKGTIKIEVAFQTSVRYIALGINNPIWVYPWELKESVVREVVDDIILVQKFTDWSLKSIQEELKERVRKSVKTGGFICTVQSLKDLEITKTEMS